MPNLLFARPNGEIMDWPALKMTARTGQTIFAPKKKDLIPLPAGATLTILPQRTPLGLDKRKSRLVSPAYNPYQEKKEKIWAVAALLPQGFTRTLVPAYGSSPNEKPVPLLGYTAVGIVQGQLMVAAIKTDEHFRWHPKNFNTSDLSSRIRAGQKKFPDNRILQQLGVCALEYGCFTAQNIFYGRWEGGIPVSPVCNALCVGCISEQPSECCPAPQRRLDFVPSLKEVVEIGCTHLQKGSGAMISFGQGCEGEPSLQGKLISASIKEIRRKTKAGIINMNTNAGSFSNMQKIIDAGIDSLRVSMISPTPEMYHQYHRPQNYQFSDVVASLIYAKEAGVYTSLNLLSFPGFTDDRDEVQRLIALIKETGVQKVQFRNLNIDPDYFLTLFPRKNYHPLGTGKMIRILKKEIPDLAIGNYS